MLCDFNPISTGSIVTDLGLPISVPEVVLIIWVTLLAADEVREVNYVSRILA